MMSPVHYVYIGMRSFLELFHGPAIDISYLHAKLGVLRYKAIMYYMSARDTAKNLTYMIEF